MGGFDPPPSTPKRRPWPLVVVILAVVVVVVVALLIVWWKRDGDLSDARANWQPPEQSFLTPMAVRPVSGWRTSVTDLGVPGPTPGASGRSTIAASNEQFGPRTFVGYIDNRAYFLASSGVPNPQWWLVGIDVSDGHRLFAPVQLGSTTYPPQCFLNGPSNVLCLYDYGPPATAWVIDGQSGAVSFTGLTDLRIGNATLAVQPVGIYVVATTQDEGVYGVGPKAETTWFVPGAGNVTGSPVDDLATQTTSGRGSDGKIVFSLAEGHVITPELAQGAQQQTTNIYQHGFVAEVGVGDELPNVEFFDLTGKRRSPQSIRGNLRTDAGGLPVIDLQNHDWAVFTVDGDKLLEVSGEKRHGSTRLIGTKLFVFEGDNYAFPLWGQYDLKTGAKGKTCDFAMDRYLGSDGPVGVFAVNNPKVGLVAKGRDLTTCATLWELPSQVASLARVWRVNTTLIQVSDDGTELMSLVAPH
jgi:hypothetical protein